MKCDICGADLNEIVKIKNNGHVRHRKNTGKIWHDEKGCHMRCLNCYDKPDNNKKSSYFLLG